MRILCPILDDNGAPTKQEVSYVDWYASPASDVGIISDSMSKRVDVAHWALSEVCNDPDLANIIEQEGVPGLGEIIHMRDCHEPCYFFHEVTV